MKCKQQISEKNSLTHHKIFLADHQGNHLTFYFRAVGKGGQGGWAIPPKILAGQLTLSQSRKGWGGGRLCPSYYVLLNPRPPRIFRPSYDPIFQVRNSSPFKTFLTGKSVATRIFQIGFHLKSAVVNGGSCPVITTHEF